MPFEVSIADRRPLAVPFDTIQVRGPVGNTANEDEPLTEINVELDSSTLDVVASTARAAVASVEEAYQQNDPPTLTVTLTRESLGAPLPADTEPSTLEPRLGVHGLATGAASEQAVTQPSVPSLSSDDDYDVEEQTSKTSEALLKAAAVSSPSAQRNVTPSSAQPSSAQPSSAQPSSAQSSSAQPSSAQQVVVKAGASPVVRKIKKSPTMQGLGGSPVVYARPPIVQTPMDAFRPIASSEIDLLARSPTSTEDPPSTVDEIAVDDDVEPPTRFVFDPESALEPSTKPKPARTAAAPAVTPAAAPKPEVAAAPRPASAPEHARAAPPVRAVREDEETQTRAEGVIAEGLYAAGDDGASAEDSTVQRTINEADLDEETQMAPSERMVAAADAAIAAMRSAATAKDPTALPENDDTTALDTSLLSGGVRLSEAVEEAANGPPTITDDDEGPTSALRSPPVATLSSSELHTDPGSLPGASAKAARGSAPDSSDSARAPVPKTQPMPLGDVQNKTLEMPRPAFLNQPSSQPRVPMALQETVPAFPPVPGSPADHGPRGTVKVMPGATGATPVSFGQAAARQGAAPKRGGGFVFFIVCAVIAAASVGFFVVRRAAPSANPMSPIVGSPAASESSGAELGPLGPLGPLAAPPESAPSAHSSPSASASARTTPSATTPIRRWPPAPPPPPPVRPGTKPSAPAPKNSAPLHI
jgi:hypothetical protein